MADNNANVIIKFFGDAANLQRALRDVSLSFDGNFIAISRLLNRFKSDSKTAVDSSAADFEKLASKLKTTVPELQAFIEKFRNLGSEAEKIRAAFKAFGSSAGGGEVAKLIPDIEKLAAAMGSGGGGGGAAGGGLAGAAEAAGAALGGLVGILAGVLALAAAVAVAFAGLLAAATKFAKSVADDDARLEELHRQTGVTIGTLNALKVATEENGKSFSTIESGLTRFINNLAIGENGTTRFARVMDQFGITSKGAFKDTDDALIKTIGKILELDTASKRSAAAFQIFGIRSDGFVQSLIQVGKNLEEARKKAENLTGVTPAITAQAKSFKTSFNDMSIAVKSIGDAIGRALIPYVQPLVDFITQVAILTRKAFVELVPLIEFIINVVAPGTLGLLKNLDLLTAVLASVPEIIKIVKDSFKGFADIAKAVGGVFVGLAGVIANGLQGNVTGAITSFEILKASAAQVVAQVAAQAASLSNKVSEIVGKNLAELLKQRAKVDEELGAGDVDFRTKLREKADAEARAQLAILNQRKLDAERTARVEVDAARRAFDEKKLSLEDYEKAVVEAEEKRLKLEREIFAEEKKIVEGSHLDAPEKKRRLAEIAEAEIDAQRRVDQIITDIQSKRRVREREAEIADRRRREQESEEADKTEVERLRHLAEERQIPFVAAEEKIASITQEGFDRRQRLLEKELELAGKNKEDQQKIIAEMNKLNQERALAAEQASKRIIDAELKELEEVKKLSAEQRRLRNEINQTKLETQRIENQIQNLDPAKQREAKKAELDFEIAVENEKSRARLEQLRADKAFKIGEDEIRGIEISDTKAFDEQIEAETARHNKEMEFLQKQKQRLLELENPLSSRSIFGNAFADTLDQTGSKLQAFGSLFQSVLEKARSEVKDFSEIGISVFNNFAGAAANMLEQFILTGKTGPAAFRRLVAGALAELAKMALFNALFYTAQGIVDLFFNPPRAAADFTAAGIWAAIAGGSALVGRAVAPGTSSSGGNGRQGSASDQQGGNRQIIQGDPRQSFNPQVIILRVDPSITVEHVKSNIQNNGTLREVITQSVGG